ncbi:MAG: hypothetical protein ACI33P_12135 [Lysinibacillus sp.]
MGKKSNSKNAESPESLINKDLAAVDIAILANLVAMISQILGMFSLFLQAEAIQEDIEAEANGSANSNSNAGSSNDVISPERFRQLEKQVQYLSKEVERLRG